MGGRERRTTSNVVAMGVGVGVRCVCRCDRPYMDSTHTQECCLPGHPTDGFLISSSHRRITKTSKTNQKVAHIHTHLHTRHRQQNNNNNNNNNNNTAEDHIALHQATYTLNTPSPGMHTFQELLRVLARGTR